jgi:hypothetical protein
LRYFSIQQGHQVHTVMVMAGGLVLLGLCVLAGRWIGGAAATADAARYFIPVWLIAAAINMWVGVTRAGYSIADEAPIFVVIFAVPAAVALLVSWKFSSA